MGIYEDTIFLELSHLNPVGQTYKKFQKIEVINNFVFFISVTICMIMN